MNIDHFISGIIGLFTGAVGSLIAPWINWRIEKKKNERMEKEKLIENLRLYVLRKDPKDIEFINSIDYIRIRPYLSNKFVEELENSNETVILMGATRSKYQSELLEQIDRIDEERKVKISKKNIVNKKYNTNSGKIKITFKH